MPIVIEGMTRMHTMDATGKPIHMPRPKKKNQKKGKKTGVVKMARGRKPAPSTRKQQKRQ